MGGGRSDGAWKATRSSSPRLFGRVLWTKISEAAGQGDLWIPRIWWAEPRCSGETSDGSETIKAKYVQGRPEDSVQFSSLMSKNNFMWLHHPALPPCSPSHLHAAPPPPLPPLPPRVCWRTSLFPQLLEASFLRFPVLRHHEPGQRGAASDHLALWLHHHRLLPLFCLHPHSQSSLEKSPMIKNRF